MGKSGVDLFDYTSSCKDCISRGYKSDLSETYLWCNRFNVKCRDASDFLDSRFCVYWEETNESIERRIKNRSW